MEKKTEISFPKTKIYYGNGTVYILYEDILYCVSNKYSDKMKNIMPLIENSNHTNSYARGYYYNFEETGVCHLHCMNRIICHLQIQYCQSWKSI